jgi:hypothetical protein
MNPESRALEAIMLEKVATRPVSRRVAITVKAPEAKDVRVTGEFTEWVEQGIRLSHDGAWKDHAEAAQRVANPYGTQNCILNVL